MTIFQEQAAIEERCGAGHMLFAALLPTTTRQPPSGSSGDSALSSLRHWLLLSSQQGNYLHIFNRLNEEYKIHKFIYLLNDY